MAAGTAMAIITPKMMAVMMNMYRSSWPYPRWNPAKPSLSVAVAPRNCLRKYQFRPAIICACTKRAAKGIWLAPRMIR